MQREAIRIRIDKADEWMKTENRIGGRIRDINKEISEKAHVRRRQKRESLEQQHERSGAELTEGGGEG